jgi:hypothetical protein
MAITTTVTDLNPGLPLRWPGNNAPYQATGDASPTTMKALRVTLTGTYETTADAFAVTVDQIGGVSAVGVIHGPCVAGDESVVINAAAVPTLGGIVFTLGYSAGDGNALGNPTSADTLDNYYIDCLVFGTPSTYANG